MNKILIYISGVIKISMRKLFIIPLLLLALFSSQSWGADFDKGVAAFQNSDYAAALKELRQSGLVVSAIAKQLNIGRSSVYRSLV